jgi:hypothetical protein
VKRAADLAVATPRGRVRSSGVLVVARFKWTLWAVQCDGSPTAPVADRRPIQGCVQPLHLLSAQGFGRGGWLVT